MPDVPSRRPQPSLEPHGGAARAARRAPPLGPFLPLVPALLVLACSELHEPLDWRDSARGGLGEEPVTFASDTLVTADLSYPAFVSTGGSSYFLAGKLSRGTAQIESRAYLRWDLEDLPSGTIREASVQLHLCDVETADSTNTGPYSLWMYRAAGAWEEDDLASPPAAGRSVARSGTISHSDSCVLRADLFKDQRLDELVAYWRDVPDSNLGVILVPDEVSQEGILGLVSRSGTPTGSTSDVLTPALVIEIDRGTQDTIVTREAVADAYVVDVAGEVGIGDAQLLVGSGYVRRALLAVDLATLLAQQPDHFVIGSAVHRATLALRILRDSDWSLPAGEELTLWLDETDDVWSEDVAPDSVVATFASSVTISGADTVAVLDIRHAVQRIFEGQQPSLLLRCATETGVFRSVLLAGRAAATPPLLELAFSPPMEGRLGGRP